jgi:hypothetical protein
MSSAAAFERWNSLGETLLSSRPCVTYETIQRYDMTKGKKNKSNGDEQLGFELFD